ncbi:hypothetical protein CRG98_035499 [Punica granatum]|uniref:RNase H type-1 domain-containing protein n=1 Tax=Punica granatum TaxID=22663 RepID=A0A2I0IJD1_PUNGR|nr:hypothetical protein CRG98_035499 [Punica granatum]
MAYLKSPHDVQRLTGRLVALSRFLARSRDKCHVFFKALKGAVELGQFDLDYAPRTVIKAQALAAFISDVMGSGVEIMNRHVKCDSQLVVQQVLRQCEAKEDMMSIYMDKGKAILFGCSSDVNDHSRELSLESGISNQTLSLASLNRVLE